MFRIVKVAKARHRWLRPIIVATQEAETRRIEFQSQPRQMVHETLSRKTRHSMRTLKIYFEARYIILCVRASSYY
jgi:hypothetical protein